MKTNGSRLVTYEARRPSDMVAKIIGADVELGSLVDNLERHEGTGRVSSRLILQAIDGVPAHRPAQGSLWPSDTTADKPDDPQDVGRKFLLTNGGGAYVDLDHPELCTPECFSAFDHLRAMHAMYRIAADAVARVNRALAPPLRVRATANNSDGLSHSYGAHVNVLVSRAAWDAIFYYKRHYAQFLASHQVSSIVLTGQGKVGSENGRRWVPYQISQRADFFERLEGWQTTHDRPILNTRDEAHCGPDPAVDAAARDGGRAVRELARLHCIFYDANLAHVATVLKVGMLQIVLAMIEAGVVPLDTLVDDPVGAVSAWSRDPSLRTRCRLAGGEEVTAVGLQRRIFEHARRFAAANDLEPIVPRAGDILLLWDDVLTKLEQGRMADLAGSLDWVLKLHILEDTLGRRDDLSWRSVQAAYLDYLYADLDCAEGLFAAYDKGGVVTRLVRESEIESFMHEPPGDTRAWTRTMLLRALGDRVVYVNWDAVAFEHPDTGAREVVWLDDPRRFTRREHDTAVAAPSAAPASAPARPAECESPRRHLRRAPARPSH